MGPGMSFSTVQLTLALIAASLSITASSITLGRLWANRTPKPPQPGHPRSSPMRAQVGIALLVASVSSGGLVAARGGAGCQELIVASSSEKFPMLQALQNDFNGSPHWTSVGGGGCMTVSVELVKSGDAEQYLETGWSGPNLPPRPDVWAPASSAWVRLLKFRAPGASGAIQVDNRSLFQSPLVIAMPVPPAAHATIGWGDISTLATAPGGSFRLGKTNPTVSSSGLNTLIGTYHASPAGDANSADILAGHAFAAGIEGSVAHYGETASDFLAGLYTADTYGQAASYISAIAMEEQEVMWYDAGNYPFQNKIVPTTQLIPVLPTNGTPYDDHPYVILTRSKQEAARKFYAFLTQQQGVFDQNLFRGQNGTAGTALSAAFARLGIPSTAPQVVPLPDGRTLDTEISEWQKIRKPARVLILVHNSGSRGPTKQALDELKVTVPKFQSQDQIGVGSYSATAGAMCSPIVFAGTPNDAAVQLANISVSGVSDVSGNGLFSVLQDAIACVKRDYNPKTINAILLVDMSPGFSQDKDSRGLLHLLRSQCPTSAAVPCQYVHVFTIGPSKPISPSNPNGVDDGMSAIATNGQGVAYPLGGSGRFLTHIIADL
jgi:Ca-activated chloride channel homolog